MTSPCCYHSHKVDLAEARVRVLEKELDRQRRANELLLRAARVLGPPGSQSTSELVTFVDLNRSSHGTKLTCVTLKSLGYKIAPATYYAAKTRQPSTRSTRDAMLEFEIKRVHALNYSVYGARRIWIQLNIEHIKVARCTVERLMRRLNISGVIRRRSWVRTTKSAPPATHAADRVNRKFTAVAPNRLWVADITYVQTRAGWVYVAFVIDVFSRRVIGWHASKTMHADLVIRALQIAVEQRLPPFPGSGELIHHSDRGVQYTSQLFVARLAIHNIIASVGRIGDCYDNALAESFNGLYKSELIYRHGPWKSLEAVRRATFCYVEWFNHKRLRGRIRGIDAGTPPADLEHEYYREDAAEIVLSIEN